MEMLATLAPILLMFVIFYFLLIRPQQKRQKQVREMQDSLQKGDHVVTIGGLHGEIHAIDEDTIILKTGGETSLTYDRAAIRETKS